MDFIQRKVVAAHTMLTLHVAGALRSHRGQGAVEYAGIVLIVAALVFAAIGAANSDILTGPISDAIEDAFDTVMGN